MSICMNKRNIPWNLIIARLEGEITNEESMRLDAWLKDEKHQKLYREVEALWKQTQERAQEYAPPPQTVGKPYFLHFQLSI